MPITWLRVENAPIDLLSTRERQGLHFLEIGHKGRQGGDVLLLEF